MDDKRLEDIEKDRKEQPDRDHKMHPPIARIDKTVPQAVPIKHVEPAQEDQQNGDAGLQGKPAFHRIEFYESLL